MSITESKDNSAMAEMTEMERLKEIIKNLDDVPSLPTVVAEVNQAIRNPRVDANTVGQILARDQALSAKTLKLVNSAFYGFPNRINSVTRAIIVMGFQRVRNLVLTASVLDKFKSGNVDFDFGNFWKHALGTAISAEILSQELKLQESEDAFVAGLLHDIGKLLVVLYAPEKFVRIHAIVKKTNCLIIEAEQEVLETTHSIVGGWLAKMWQFPPKLTQAIRMHHDPQSVREYHEMTYVTHIADIVCRALDFGDGGDNKIPKINGHVWKAMKLDKNILDSVMKKTLEGFDKAKDFLQLLQ